MFLTIVDVQVGRVPDICQQWTRLTSPLLRVLFVNFDCTPVVLICCMREDYKNKGTCPPNFAHNDFVVSHPPRQNDDLAQSLVLKITLSLILHMAWVRRSDRECPSSRMITQRDDEGITCSSSFGFDIAAGTLSSLYLHRRLLWLK